MTDMIIGLKKGHQKVLKYIVDYNRGNTLMYHGRLQTRLLYPYILL